MLRALGALVILVLPFSLGCTGADPAPSERPAAESAAEVEDAGSEGLISSEDFEDGTTGSLEVVASGPDAEPTDEGVAADPSAEGAEVEDAENED